MLKIPEDDGTILISLDHETDSLSSSEYSQKEMWRRTHFTLIERIRSRSQEIIQDLQLKATDIIRVETFPRVVICQSAPLTVDRGFSEADVISFK
jgi:hypothetical protein